MMAALSAPTPEVEHVARRLIARGETIAFAESCTGGRVSAMIATFSGISAAFQGSVVSYANEVKQDILGVPEALLKTHGAVSAPVALKMAEGARSRLKSDWAVAITGIAGPGGGSVEKPVGTVFFGIAGPKLEATEHKIFQGSRTEIQQAASNFALEFLARYLG